MTLAVEQIISFNKPMCEYRTKYTGELDLYEKGGDYVVMYRSELNIIDPIVLTLTAEFSHAAHVYETVKKQMEEVEKGMANISQTLRKSIAENCVGWQYKNVAEATSYRTASNYDNIKEGMKDVVAPIIEQYLTVGETK